MRKSTLRRVLSCLIVVSVAGCEGIPTHMHVRHGVEPEHADKDVVFRTTYYFRVFDVCDGAGDGTSGSSSLVFVNKNGHGQKLLKDSLYRFVMTGKANPLLNQISFESGTLKSFEIDPLGATVDFDETNRRFLFKSRTETELDAQRDQTGNEIARLMKLRQELAADEDTDPALAAAVDAVIVEHVRTLSPVGIRGFVGNKPLSDTAEMQIAASKAADRVAGKFEKLVPDAFTATHSDARKAVDTLVTNTKGAESLAKDYRESLKPLGAVLNTAAPKFPTALTEVAKSPPNKDALKPVKEAMDRIPGLAKSLEDKLAAVSAQIKLVVSDREAVGRQLEAGRKPAGALAGEAMGLIEARKGIEDAIVAAAKAQHDLDTQNRWARNASDEAAQAFEKSEEAVGKLAEASAGLVKTTLPNPRIATDEIAKLAAEPIQKAREAKIAYDKADAALKPDKPDTAAVTAALEAAKTALDEAVAAIDALTNSLSDDAITQEIKSVEKLSADFQLDETTASGVKNGAAAVGKSFRTIAQKLSMAGSSNAASAYSIVAHQLAAPRDACDEEGGNVRRGFQIMGPEGVKTFDQEDRLIMAMSTSAKPLIGVLKDLSARVLNQRATGADQLLPLARERSAILRAQRGLDQARAASEATPESIVDATIAGFEQGRSQ